MTVILIYMILILLTFRTHYAIDISTGLIVAHYSFIMISYISSYLDNFFKSIYKKCMEYVEQSKWYKESAKRT